MNILGFIAQNWDFILLIAAAVVAVVYFAFKGNKSVIMKMLDGLVTEAEMAYGGGTGPLKLAAVIEEIYPMLPTVVKMFITDKTLTKWVEDALTAAKKKWRENPALAAYVGLAVCGDAETYEGEATSEAAETFLKDSYN